MVQGKIKFHLINNHQTKGAKQMINTQNTFEQILQREIEKLDQVDDRINETVQEYQDINYQLKQMEQEK